MTAQVTVLYKRTWKTPLLIPVTKHCIFKMAAPLNESIALSWTPEFAAYAPSKEHKAWAIATLKAPLFEPTARAPVDICAVIDRSGSMHGEKLELVKETLEFVIDQRKD